jgi:hypothetical protein
MIASFPWLLPAQHFMFRTYGRHEGLGGPSVRCILQDRIGFLWVGSNSHAFFPEADGSVWIGTANLSAIIRMPRM